MNSGGWRKKFFVIWTGQGISTLTSSIVQMAIIWYITRKTKSAAVLSFATLAGFLPQAVLGMFIGVLIDQYDRKKIMIWMIPAKYVSGRQSMIQLPGPG